MKPIAMNVAARAIKAKDEGITYARMKCDAYIEYCVNECGGTLQTSGINDMVRNHNAWLGTLANARAEKKLVKGALLLIWREESPKLPAQYRGDGLGDFYHGAIYVGEKALYDTDKDGKKRLCNAMHSSETMGRVAGTTTENGYTHVLWLSEIDYGVEVQPGVSLGAEAAQGDEQAAPVEAAPVQTARKANVMSPDGNPVKLRPQRKREKLYWEVSNGAPALIEREKDGWALITARCTDGVTRRAWMMCKYLF